MELHRLRGCHKTPCRKQHARDRKAARRVLLQAPRGCHKTPSCRQHARGRKAARRVLLQAQKVLFRNICAPCTHVARAFGCHHLPSSLRPPASSLAGAARVGNVPIRLAAIVFALSAAHFARGDSTAPWYGDGAFEFRRKVDLRSLSPFPRVVVAEWYTHGAVRSNGTNVAAVDSQGRLPLTVLQTGPGDFLRVAIEPRAGQTELFLYYGGNGLQDDPPRWTTRAGLVVETRRWKPCDLNRLDSLRSAFAAAHPIGRDYVKQVFHSYNPLDPAPAPFLTHYSGTLRIKVDGTYQFFTSSQDCSFLLIDGKQVVAAPGRHGPIRRARLRGSLKLDKGTHTFDYWHAASGTAATMVAAWQPPRAKQPALIPAEVFDSAHIVRLPALELEHRQQGKVPYFTPRIVGEVVLPNSDSPLVQVRFEDIASRGLTRGANVEWEFGDGQTSSGTSPQHVYMRPGVYTVTMTVQRKKEPVRLVHRIWIYRPAVILRGNRQPDRLSQYLPTLTTYDPATLPGPDLLQLVRAFEVAGKLREAVDAAKTAFDPRSRELQNDVLHQLAVAAGRLARNELGDAQTAWEIYRRAAERISSPRERAECLIAAADTAIHDLLRLEQVEGQLRRAERAATRSSPSELAARYYRVRGDWYARKGDGAAARADYRRAARAKPVRSGVTQRSAWRGAYSRFVESFLLDGKLKEAKQKLDAWLSDFPADRIDGYHSLLQARYWAAAGRLPQAIAVASDSLAINPASAYAAQLVQRIAEWEEKQGHTDRAISAYRSLVADYPGSPLVAQAKKALQRLTAKPPATREEQKK